MTLQQDLLALVFEEKTEAEHICVAEAKPKANGQASWLNMTPDEGKYRAWERRPEKLEKAMYFCVSTVGGARHEEYGYLRRRREDLVRYHCLVLDDIGDKASPPPVDPAWKIETSPGSYHYGFLLEPGNDWSRYEGLLEVCHARGWGDEGAGGAYRMTRLPGSTNTKPGRGNFKSRIEFGEPVTWTLEDLAQAFGIGDAEWAEATARIEDKAGGKGLRSSPHAVRTGPIDQDEDKVLVWLSSAGMVKEDQGDKVQIKCPWHQEHSDPNDDAAAYWPLGRAGEIKLGAGRGFKCLHGHCKDRNTDTFLEWVAGSGGPEARRWDPLELAQARVVYVGKGRRIVDLRQRRLGGSWQWPFEDWSMANYVTVPTGDKGKPPLLSRALLSSFSTRQAVDIVYRPGQGELFEENGQTYVNGYVEPCWPETDALPVEFLRHLEYLLPVKAERECFLDWLAYKVQNPGSRSYAVVMVARDAYGTGRSLIGEYLSTMMRHQTTKATLAQLVGKGTGGENTFNDWLAESQFLVVEEAKDVSRDEFYRLYETFKERIDMVPVRFWRNSKYGAARWDSMWFNALILSNHADAIALPEGDRRVAVFSNPTERRSEAEYGVLREAMKTEVGALYWLLKRRDLTGYSHVYPPMTPSKEDMIGAAKGPSEELWEWIVENCPSDLVTKKILERQVIFASRECAMDSVARNPERMVGMLWKHHCMPLNDDAKNGFRVRIDGKQTAVKALREEDQWFGTADFDAVCAELEKANVTAPFTGPRSPLTSSQSPSQAGE